MIPRGWSLWLHQGPGTLASARDEAENEAKRRTVVIFQGRQWRQMNHNGYVHDWNLYAFKQIVRSCDWITIYQINSSWRDSDWYDSRKKYVQKHNPCPFCLLICCEMFYFTRLLSGTRNETLRITKPVTACVPKGSYCARWSRHTTHKYYGMAILE